MRRREKKPYDACAECGIIKPMPGIDPRIWNSALQELWSRIKDHRLEAEDALDFTRRLARDHDWTTEFARSAIFEYRRFCFLAVTGSTPVTPSEEVDEVWHLHLTYSRDYWDVWCGNILGKPLHHDPTRGGPAEQSKYRSQYAATLARYEQFFGPPSAEFWPATHHRFRNMPRYRILDSDKWIRLPRPAALWGRIQQFRRKNAAESLELDSDPVFGILRRCRSDILRRRLHPSVIARSPDRR